MNTRKDRAVRISVVEMGQTRGEAAKSFGGFAEWFLRAFGEAVTGTEIEVLPVGTATADCLIQSTGVVLTGAYEGVYDDIPWRDKFDREMESLIHSGTPIPGVCFGHRYLTALPGGEVEYSPEKEEMGWCEVEVTREGASGPLLSGLPRKFGAYQTHHDRVTRTAEEAVAPARSVLVSVQAFRFEDRIWGVQFHPEMTGEIMETVLAEEIRIARSDGDFKREAGLKAASELSGRVRGARKSGVRFAGSFRAGSQPVEPPSRVRGSTLFSNNRFHADFDFENRSEWRFEGVIELRGDL